MAYEDAEKRWLKLVEEAPHLRGVDLNVTPTIGVPCAVHLFDWPGTNPFDTTSDDTIYESYVDLYFSMGNAARAQAQMREVLLYLKEAVRKDRTLGGTCLDVTLVNGGRALFNDDLLVKPMGVRITMEEAR